MSESHHYYGRHDEFALAALRSGRYQVTPEGVLWATHSRGLFKPHPVRSWIAAGGYALVTIAHDGKRLNFFLHRIVALIWVFRPDHAVQVNHIDGVKTNNHYRNLEWVTSSENCQHAYDSGLTIANPSHGESSHWAVLNEATVETVLRLRKQGLSYGLISLRTGVSRANVAVICVGKTWKHVYKRVMESGT